MALAGRIREVRTEHLKLSQRGLAVALGTDATSVSRWERGVVEPKMRTLRELARMSGKPLAWFFTEDEEMVA